MSEIVNKMSEGLFNSFSRPRKLFRRRLRMNFDVGVDFEFQPIVERKRRPERKPVFSMNIFAE